MCLSAADLEDAGERPVVADCILSLQAWWQAQQAEAAGLRASASWPRPPSAGSGAASVSPSGIPPSAAAAAAATPPPLRTPPSPVVPPAASSPEFSFTPHAAAAVHRASGQQRQDGLEYLMRTCNHMLKSSMGAWPGAGRSGRACWSQPAKPSEVCMPARCTLQGVTMTRAVQSYV